MSDKIHELMAAEFSEWFRRTRRVLDVTQKQFSAAWGRGQSAVSDIERGDRVEYTAEDVAGIVEALLACAVSPSENTAEIERDAYIAAGLLPPSDRRNPSAHKVVPELEREPDEEYLRESIMAYTGTDPILAASAATARSLKKMFDNAGPALTGDEPNEVIARGRRKGITKVDGK